MRTICKSKSKKKKKKEDFMSFVVWFLLSNSCEDKNVLHMMPFAKI